MQTVQATETPHRTTQPVIGDDVLLDSAQTRASVGGKSNMCLWRWQRNPKVNFPAPDLVINKRRYWYAGTIRRWKARCATKAAE
jgi:hypothetical protein